MASSNIKLFDENKGNMLNDTEFNISTQRLNGLQTGVASSQLQNKAMYQASLMAYSIAQLMLANGKNANDTDAVSTFVNNLLASIVQKVADKATEQDVVDGVVGKWISSELLKSNNEELKRYVGGNYVKLAFGTYVGTGTHGESNPVTVTFPFPIKFFAFPQISSYFGNTSIVLMDQLPVDSEGVYVKTPSSSVLAKRSADNKSISWYGYGTSSAEKMLDVLGMTYYYAYGGYDE